MSDFEFVGDLIAVLYIRPDNLDVVESIRCAICNEVIVSSTEMNEDEALRLVAGHIFRETVVASLKVVGTEKPRDEKHRIPPGCSFVVYRSGEPEGDRTVSYVVAEVPN